MYEQLLELDSVTLNFGGSGSLILSLVQGFVMFGVALGIKMQNFKNAFLHPRSVLVGLVSQILVLPAVTFILVFLFRSHLTVTVALGTILVACCPGGNISNFISSISKGNVELSVSLTAITTVTAVVITPINFSFWGNLFIMHSDLVRDLQIPVSEVFNTLFFIIGLPLALGMLFSKFWPNLTQKISKPIQRITMIIFMGMVVVAFLANFDYFCRYIKYILLVVLVHNAVAFLSGYGSAAVFGLHERNCRTITIETGIQNSGLALMLIFNPAIFPSDIETGGMAFVAAWWGVWHIISGIGLSAFWGWQRRRRYRQITSSR